MFHPSMIVPGIFELTGHQLRACEPQTRAQRVILAVLIARADVRELVWWGRYVRMLMRGLRVEVGQMTGEHVSRSE